MAKVLLENVSKRFPAGTVAVNQLDLEINDREFLVLIGPSGCGKSTTLRLIAGLETSTSGEVKIGERVVTHMQPKDRNIAMVFQNYALYPGMTVYENIKFGLSLRKLRNGFLGLFDGGVLTRGLRKIFQPLKSSETNRANEEIDNQVRQTACRLGIEHLLDRKPHQLSGGERQRVALGRAIVRNPAAFLFDEPLSNLDANLRQQMRMELKRLHQELQATMIYVTHDHVDAMTLADRVAVMNDGKVLQVGKPLEIYQQPANLFVAKLIGGSPINLCEGTVTRTNETIRFEHLQHQGVHFEWKSGTLVFESLDKVMKPGKAAKSVVLGFRPENVMITNNGSVEGQVAQVDQLGDSNLVHLSLEQVDANLTGNDDKPKTESTTLTITARQDPNTNLAVGDRVKLAIDPDRVVWFDPETGNNLAKE